MLNIVCIGAGVMSSAFAVAQSTRNKVSIIPAPFDNDLVVEIQKSGFDKRLDVSWPEIPFVDTKVEDFDLLVVGVSSLGIPWVIQIINRLFKTKKVPILLLTKGLMEKDGQLWLISEYMEALLKTSIISVSGPCIAKLLAKQNNTEVILSGKDIDKYTALIESIELPFCKLYITNDYIGTAWASALKNCYAILVAKESYNANIRSARFAQAIVEMKEWIVEVGGRADTVYGLSGLGDLYVTCQGGRNGQLGQHLADGLTIDDILDGPMKGVTVEGIDLAVVLTELACYKNKPLFEELAKLVDASVSS